MKEAEVIKYALDRIGGRWKSMIVWELKHGPKRFSDLKSDISGITQKMLTSSLVELQKDGLLVRKSFPQIPPRVEYTLTTLGESMVPISAALYEWGALNQGIEVAPSNWKANLLAEEVIIETELAQDLVSESEAVSTEQTPVLDYSNSQAVEQPVTEPISEKVTEETIDNDPWFFAPLPQKNVVKKKSSKKSSSNDSGTQQLGLF